jgi:hypothetical protein
VNDLFDAAGAIVRQYSYGTYGELLETESLGAHPDNSVGFQGMFFDRIGEPGSVAAFEVGAIGFYLTANRAYDPELGRWLQRDPNATAQPILAYAASMGQTLSLGADAFDLDSLFADGMNLYVFVGNNPINFRDPSGLDLSLWLAEQFLRVTDNFVGRFLDDKEGVRSVAIGFGLAGAGLLGGAIIVGATPAIVAATQSALAWAAGTGAGASAIAGAATLIPRLATLTFSDGARRGMERGAIITRSVVDQVLRFGTRTPDPQGVANTFMYRSQVWANGRMRDIEVLWNATENAVWHVLMK